ncbi:hypothetical protein [Streptomyces sp. URMC 123]|uniref:hypothetical protein n=1 Tax=Streptomyces sp. URMC 123 TaxID=3423403 RepID=UPI003F1CD0DE
MRRVVVVTLGGFAFLGLLATPASAVPDPVATVECAVQEATGFVDPTNLAIPPEVPGVACLAP